MSVGWSVGRSVGRSVTFYFFLPIKAANRRRKKLSMKVFPLLVFSRVHATLQPALSVGRSVGRSVGHVLLFFMILFSDLTAPAQMV